MDPYSYSVEREASKNIEENERECFKDAIVSSRSLNKGFVEPTKIKNAIPEISACFIAATFHIAVGLSMAYSAILIPVLQKNSTSTENHSNSSFSNWTEPQELHATKEECSWIASIVILCTPLGAFFGSFLMESLGRKRTLQIGTIPCVAGYILIATAENLPMIFIGRVLAGFATALATSPAIVYITEVARPELRGALMSFGPTLASLGMLLAYLMGAFLSWRDVAWFSIIFAVFPLFLIQIVVPESPVWLVSKGKVEEAKKSLEWFYRFEDMGKVSALDSQFSMIMKENEIRLSNQRRSQRSGFSTKFRAFLKPTGWKPMFILFMFFLFQQFSGIYITLFYAVNWFDGIEINAYIASILVGLTRFLCSMVNTVLLRRFKRRVLCIISGVGMSICMSVSGYYKLKIEQGSTEGNWVPVLCLLLYVCTSMIGMLTIPWTMTAELFPTEIRHIAHSISYSMANLLMFGAVQSYFGLIEILGAPYRLHWFFAAVSLGAAAFVWLLLPETHGKKLSEIEEYFHNNFIAVGAESKERKRRIKRRQQQKAKAAVREPLNAKSPQSV